jgi:hypothetical protein
MYCPNCGTENTGTEVRFCRSCGVDLRTVSQALNKSVPVKIASKLDAYLENRFQRNFANGVVNLIAFVALIVVGSGFLISGRLSYGVFMLGLGLLSLFMGVWDIWIYRRNLPPVANRSEIIPSSSTKELDTSMPSAPPPPSIAEPTTKRLDLTNH